MSSLDVSIIRNHREKTGQLPSQEPSAVRTMEDGRLDIIPRQVRGKDQDQSLLMKKSGPEPARPRRVKVKSSDAYRCAGPTFPLAEQTSFLSPRTQKGEATAYLSQSQCGPQQPEQKSTVSS